jgi:signal transduction histidine kinase
VLVNLGGNAVKFTDKGFVRISVESDTAEARFAVADSGPGISREDLALLFRPFTQLDTGLTRRHGGTGLGLYVSRTLATLLGARIDVQSTVGEGSVFTLVLPRALPGT